MLAFFAILASALCGYAQATPMTWPVAALALASVSWAQSYTVIRRGLEVESDEVVWDTLTKSLMNAIVTTGACYWVGVLFRYLSGL
ncbi:unnamed protein product [Phaeothamnion confervicola]